MAGEETEPPEKQGPYRGGNPPEEHRWKPGQSGNPKGRPRKTAWVDALMSELEAEPDHARLMAKRILEIAKGGDTDAAALKALEQIEDRIGGKVVNQVEVQAEFRHTIEYIEDTGDGDPTAGQPTP